MWHWDQGHLAYFQFDALRQISVFITKHDFKTAQREELLQTTGLAFAAPKLILRGGSIQEFLNCVCW